MKSIIALLALTLSVASFAQERKILDQKKESVSSDSAILVRTANTPNVVEVTFMVPMANSYCADPRVETVYRTCERRDTYYTTQRQCRMEPVPPSNPNAPRGPNYRPPMREVCRDVQVPRTRIVRYDCSYSRSWCAHYGTDVSREADKVKIKFKNMPALGGTEEEEIKVSARQREKNATNVLYDIEVSDKYEVVKKGILGFDSYVIQPK